MNEKGTIFTRTYCIKTTKVKVYWRLMINILQVR